MELLPGAVNNREPLRCLATEHIEPDRAEEWRYPEITGETLAVLQYSSGSTGDPNGVMLTHDNLLDNQRMIREAFGHTDQSVGVSWLPFYHDMGLVENVLHPLYVGGLTALMSPVDFLQRPIRWLEAISRYRATTSGGPNFAYELCVRRITSEQRASLDLSSWEVAFNAAEQVRKETLDEFTEAFEPYGFRRSAFQPCYGLAETTVFVSGGPRTARPSVLTVEAQALETDRIVLEPDTARDGNTRSIVGCGRPGIRQDVVIVDPNSSTECPPARVGEIWVAGANVAKGYWNRDEKTQLTFGAHLADSGDGPYLRTGDLGFFRDGELFITGRLNDRIIIAGRNHYPTDIERTVEKSDPLVRPGCCAAFSVDIDGHEQLVVTAEVDGKYKRRGSHGSARPESSMPPATLDIDAMVMSIRRAVAEEHGLRAHSVVLLKRGTLPKTSSAKIKRYACRAGFLAGTLDKVGE